jgi:hypothetical protein
VAKSLNLNWIGLKIGIRYSKTMLINVKTIILGIKFFLVVVINKKKANPYFLKRKYNFIQNWDLFLIQGDQLTTVQLNNLFNESLSDKGLHGYARIYSNILKCCDFDGILEYGIGATSPVNNMNSLRIWKKISPKSEIVGFDKEPSKLFSDTGISTVKLDQTNLREIEDETLKCVDQFKDKSILIIDDGLHEPQSFFNVLRVFSKIDKSKTFLIIEDLRITYVFMLYFWNHFYGPRSNGLILTVNKENEIIRINNLFSIVKNCRNWNNVYITANFSI